jgi:hypothetical protein
MPTAIPPKHKSEQRRRPEYWSAAFCRILYAWTACARFPNGVFVMCGRCTARRFLCGKMSETQKEKAYGRFRLPLTPLKRFFKLGNAAC